MPSAHIGLADKSAEPQKAIKCSERYSGTSPTLLDHWKNNARLKMRSRLRHKKPAIVGAFCVHEIGGHRPAGAEITWPSL
jgi:hypothetical protein